MAESPSHRFGQIIGYALEKAVEPILQKFAQEYGLYLDRQGARPIRKGLKVSWIDLKGNTHDLDFVLEKSGSPTRQGTPAAFIETAWRRFTKHSKNKVQEIESAVMPLVEAYKNYGPFCGAILAGEFTKKALDQLKSKGFTVLYFPYDNVVRAFETVNIDASSEEGTPDSEFADKVVAWEALSEEQQLSVARKLVDIHNKEVAIFVNTLKNAITRQIELVRVLPLHGTIFNAKTIEEAIVFIESYDETHSVEVFERYEVEVRHVNGDFIQADYQSKARVIEFLQIHQLVPKI